MPRWTQAVLAHVEELDRIKDREAKGFLDNLVDLRLQLQGRLATVGANDATFDANRLRVALAETDLGIKRLRQRLAGDFSSGREAVFGLAIEHTTDELERMGREFDARPLPVNLHAARVLSDPGHELVAMQHQSSVDKYGADMLARVQQRLFVAVRAGDTVGQVVDSLAAPLGPLGNVARSDAERLVRTELSAAYGAAQERSLREAAAQVPGLKKTWVHVGSYKCDICEKLHMTQRDIDGGVWVIKGNYKVTHPPAHPHCVCVLRGMKKSWGDKLDKLGYGKPKAEPGKPVEPPKPKPKPETAKPPEVLPPPEPAVPPPAPVVAAPPPAPPPPVQELPQTADPSLEGVVRELDQLVGYVGGVSSKLKRRDDAKEQAQLKQVVAKVVHDAGFAPLLREKPLRHVEFHDHEMLPGAEGAYYGGQLMMFPSVVNSEKAQASNAKSQKAMASGDRPWSIVSPAGNAMHAVLVHEISHHMHQSARELAGALNNSDIRERGRFPSSTTSAKQAAIKDALMDVERHAANQVLLKTGPSLYADTNIAEWIAEAHTAYVVAPDFFRQKDAAGFKLIAALRKALGMK